ncbi:MAG: heme ABC exporter ATP-binding protein CcmA [Sphingobium sp.]|nr:heme ABC exporter ATP-binding protein CcmA [Sphingobium sp.]
MSAAWLAIKGLACRRGGRLLFAGLDLDLAAGQSALIAGPNGIGKSSLLRIVAGLLSPIAGTVEGDGTIALTDEAAALDREKTLRAALGFWAKLDGVGLDRVDAALADLGIGHLADIPVRILSTGQRKRAALARTIASGANIWLLDEPANGLDVASAQALAQAVEHHRARGGIILAASHMPLGWRHDGELTLAAPEEAPA